MIVQVIVHLEKSVNQYKIWTPEEDKVLEQNSQHGSAYIAKLLNRSICSIVSRAYKLGISLGIHWPDKDIAFLKEHYETEGPCYCAKALNRSYASITSKASILKLVYKKISIENEWLKNNIHEGYYFCQQKLNLSESGLHHRLKKLGLVHYTNPWTNDKETFLRDKYPTLGVAACALALGKTKHAIRSKANKLGIRTQYQKPVIYIIGNMYGTFWRNIKAHAKAKGLILNITPADIWQLFLNQDKKCIFCNDIISLAQPITGSLDRIDNTIGYILSNVQLTCILCNLMKGRYTDAILIKQSHKISTHRKIKEY